MDVLPDIEFGPVGQGKDPDALAFVDTRIVQVPKLWPLVLGVPLAEGVAKGVDALFGAGLLLVAPRAAKGRVVAALVQGVQQGAGLQQTATFFRTQPERVRS